MKAAGNDRKPRGELAELSSQLQNLCTAGKRTDKELRTAKKDVFKRVINYMTLGMDMSSLFPMMTSCANLSADDLVLKKMLYLYLTHYATQTPDLALLTINQLQKDFADHDPMIRGLALRSLCSLRVTNFLEYVVGCKLGCGEGVFMCVGMHMAVASEGTRGGSQPKQLRWTAWHSLPWLSCLARQAA